MSVSFGYLQGWRCTEPTAVVELSLVKTEQWHFLCFSWCLLVLTVWLMASEKGPVPSPLLLPAPLEPGIYSCKKYCPFPPKPSLVQTLLNLSLSVSFSNSLIIFLSLTGSAPLCPDLSSAGSSALQRCRGAASPPLACWQHFSQWSQECLLCCKGPLLAPVQPVHQDHQLFFLQNCFSASQSHAALPAAGTGGWDYSSSF